MYDGREGYAVLCPVRDDAEGAIIISGNVIELGYIINTTNVFYLTMEGGNL